MRTEFAPSFPVTIFIAGDYYEAWKVCRAYCDEVGACVTLTPTKYIYTGGDEDGLIVGLINYPRFPAESVHIEAKAIELGHRLREALGQESFSVQTPTTTTWFSWREDDLAIAAAARSGGTEIPHRPNTGGHST
jgi:hypothetical protein